MAHTRTVVDLVRKYLITELTNRATDKKDPTVPMGIYTIIAHADGRDEVEKLCEKYIDMDKYGLFCASGIEPKIAMMPEEFCKHCKKYREKKEINEISQINRCWLTYAEHNGKLVYLVEMEDKLNEDARVVIVWDFNKEFLNELYSLYNFDGDFEKIVIKIEKALGLGGWSTVQV